MFSSVRTLQERTCSAIKQHSGCTHLSLLLFHHWQNNCITLSHTCLYVFRSILPVHSPSASLSIRPSLLFSSMLVRTPLIHVSQFEFCHLPCLFLLPEVSNLTWAHGGNEEKYPCTPSITWFGCFHSTEWGVVINTYRSSLSVSYVCWSLEACIFSWLLGSDASSKCSMKGWW